MKYSYYVITCRFYNTKEDKYYYYADIMRIGTSDNILSRLDAIAGIYSMNLCETKKQAEKICDEWNDCYKLNGTYFLDCNNISWWNDDNDFITASYKIA